MSIALPTTESHAETCGEGANDVNQGEDIEDGDRQDHPNLRMQWRWTVVTERDTK